MKLSDLRKFRKVSHKVRWIFRFKVPCFTKPRYFSSTTCDLKKVSSAWYAEGFNFGLNPTFLFQLNIKEMCVCTFNWTCVMTVAEVNDTSTILFWTESILSKSNILVSFAVLRWYFCVWFSPQHVPQIARRKLHPKICLRYFKECGARKSPL